MIRFTLNHLNGSDSLEGMFQGTTEMVTPRLREGADFRASQIDVSVEEAIAITLIDIRQTLRRLLVKVETALPDPD